MAGPYGIEQVDVGRALQFYGAGRDRRMQDIEIEKARRAEELARAKSGVYANALRGDYNKPKGGDPMSPAGLVATPGQEAESAAFDARFPETRNMTPSDAAPVNPLMDPRVRQRLVGEITAIDATEVPQLFEMFAKLDDAQLDRAKKVYGLGSAVAFELRNAPPEQREAIRQQRIQQLSQTIPQFAEILQRTGMDDRSLEALVNQGRDIEKIIDSAMPKTVTVPEGGTIYERGPASPYQSFGGAQPQIPPEAIAELQANPQAAAQFDEVFGPGASQRVLGRENKSAGGNMMTQSQLRAVQQSMGPAAAARWVEANKIRVVAD